MLVGQGELDRARALLAESLATAQRLGDSRGIANCLETLVAVAAAAGDAEPTRAFLRAADELRDSIGSRRFPDEATEVDALRAAVGDGAGGDGTTLEAALSYARLTPSRGRARRGR